MDVEWGAWIALCTVWLSAMAVVWRALSINAGLAGSRQSAGDRERHDHMRLVVQMVEKMTQNTEKTTRIHAQERSDQSKTDASVQKSYRNVTEPVKTAPQPDYCSPEEASA